MHSSWDPLTLSFSDAELEAHYTKYLLLCTFLHVDLAFAYFGFFANTLITVSGLLFGPPSLILHLVLVVNNLFALFVTVALNSRWRSWYFEHRTILLLTLRTHQAAATVYSYWIMNMAVSGWKQLLRIIAFGAACVYWSCGMPLKFKVSYLRPYPA